MVSPSAVGYNPATDTLTSAVLRLTFSNANQGNDFVDILLDTTLTFDNFDLNNPITSDAAQGVDFVVSLALLSDGILNVQLVKEGTPGDFIFNGSQLTVMANRAARDDPQVPEPGTLGLFGFGLIGLGLARQRRRRRH